MPQRLWEEESRRIFLGRVGRLPNQRDIGRILAILSPMSNPISSSSAGSSRSSINLVRSSHSWTEADSAAGFVLRYLAPMRRQLTKVMGSTKEADEALRLLLSHLVTAGFGDHKKGRLRDFLVRGIRSCAKARVNELPEEGRPQLDLSEVQLESPQWVGFWRDCLLERSWRALERIEHQDPETPYYSVLWAATTNPKATVDELVTMANKTASQSVDSNAVNRLLPESKAMFAQLLADEVVETLQSPTKADVKQEIKQLGMAGAFAGLATS